MKTFKEKKGCVPKKEISIFGAAGASHASCVRSLACCATEQEVASSMFSISLSTHTSSWSLLSSWTYSCCTSCPRCSQVRTEHPQSPNHKSPSTTPSRSKYIDLLNYQRPVRPVMRWLQPRAPMISLQIRPNLRAARIFSHPLSPSSLQVSIQYSPKNIISNIS